MSDIELSAKERNAIRKLKQVAANWPETLWLYSGNGTLNVIRVNEEGHRATDCGAVDHNYVVDCIDIPNEGGDW
jgi:hypothetical protein